MNSEVAGVACDSRRVGPGFLFVAIPGAQQDGYDFIPEAVTRGAGAVVTTRRHPAAQKITQVIVKNPRNTLAAVSSRFYGNPSARLRVIGITGTNGKTTLTYLLESILTAAGRKVAVVGTVNRRYGGKTLPVANTTPESVDLQAFFQEVLQTGGTDVVMEVSSHALTQERVREVQFDVAAFTNLSQDHLDYHENMDDYFAAKQSLFTDFLMSSPKKGKGAVINGDDPRASELTQHYQGPLIKTGLTAGCDLKPLDYELTEEGIRLEVKLAGPSVVITSPLIGKFNLENILLAVGIAAHLQVPAEAVVRGIAQLSGVPGRLERITNAKGIHVFVDYAHTPDALARVGVELKALTRGRLITVFGCGGDRDRSKRPLMGQEAARFSDHIVVTSDNPRTEDPQKIIKEIQLGLKGFSGVEVIVDRAQALQHAVELALPGDTLLVAGKGHEDYQIIGTKKIHFSDQEVLRKLLGS